MATEQITMMYPFYVNGYYREPAAYYTNGTYSQVFDGPGDSGNAGGPSLLLRTEDTNPYWERNSFIDMLIDLRAFKYATFTSAYITLQCSQFFNENFWGNTSRDGIALVNQDESIRTTEVAAINYDAIHWGCVSGSEYASRISSTTLAASVGSNIQFTLNAAGINYLNTVKSKTYLKGYAALGIAWGGQADDIAPPSYPGINQAQLFRSGSNRSITVTFTIPSKHYINIGDGWKQVAGGYVNVGDEWMGIDDIDINVGDVWKNV